MHFTRLCDCFLAVTALYKHRPNPAGNGHCQTREQRLSVLLLPPPGRLQLQLECTSVSISNIPFILATIFIHILFLVLFNSSVGVNSFIHSFFPVALLASLSSRYLLHLCSQTKEHIFARPNQLDAPDKQNTLPDQQKQLQSLMINCFIYFIRLFVEFNQLANGYAGLMVLVLVESTR